MADQPSSGKKRYANSGIITKNDPKKLEANPKAAPYGGSLDIDCPHCKAQIEMWINAYVNEFRDGRKYFSLKFNPKNGAPRGPKPPVVQTRPQQPWPQTKPQPRPAPAPTAEAAPEPTPEPPADNDEDYRY